MQKDTATRVARDVITITQFMLRNAGSRPERRRRGFVIAIMRSTSIINPFHILHKSLGVIDAAIHSPSISDETENSKASIP